VPGDFLMLALGAHAREGRVPLWQALLVLELATLLGGSVLYLLANRAGRSLVFRYGRYMHLTPERLERAEAFLRRRGTLAIVVGRNTPGLRMATVVACGVFGVPYARFLPSLALGGGIYILLYTLLGFYFGRVVLDVLEGIHLPIGVLGSLVPLVLLLVWLVRARRGLLLRPHTEAGAVDPGHRWRDGAIAGGLATVVSTLAMNVLVHLAGDLALVAPGELVERTQARLAVFALARVIGPVLLLAAAPAFIVVGIAWGAAYGTWVEPHLHWPDWVSGAGFALLPLTLALVVVLPVMDTAGLEPLGPLAAASEAVRHIVYGAVLGMSYPLRLARLPVGFGGRAARVAPTSAAAY
jgi:membrane protein DedA with SNARE-associated domain